MLKETPDGLIIKLKIVPNSSKNDIVLEDEFIKIKLTAQPIENKANKALIEYLSKSFKIAKTSIEIVKGDNSKEKTIIIKITDKNKTEIVGADSGKLLPTDLGRIANDFLVDQFPTILSYDFTAHSEESFDAIAAGEANWVQTVDEFYKTFHPLIKQVPAGKMAARLVGKHPQTGEPLLARITKNGPCVQLGDSDSEKPKFVSMQKGQSIFTITLDEALALFANALPRTLGVYNDQEMIVGEGRYGAYVRYAGEFTSLPKNADPYTFSLEEAITLIENKKQAEEPIHVFGDIQVLNGRYGAYIKTPKGNFRIPKSTNVLTLTEEECLALINSSEPASTKKRFTRKK